MSTPAGQSSPSEFEGNIEYGVAGRLFALARQAHDQYADFANHLGRLWIANADSLVGLGAHASRSDYRTPQQNFDVELPGADDSQKRSVTLTHTKGSPYVTGRCALGDWDELAQQEAEFTLETGLPLTTDAAYTRLQDRPCRTIRGNEAMNLYTGVVLGICSLLHRLDFLTPDSLRDSSQPPSRI